jgi:hypothetical protein
MQSGAASEGILNFLLELAVLVFGMGAGYAKLKGRQAGLQKAVHELEQGRDEYVRTDVANERHQLILAAFEDQNRRLERIETKLDRIRK